MPLFLRCIVFAGLPALLVGAASADDFLLRDDFNGKTSLDWKIDRPDESHYSLTSNEGCLTITTQGGTIHKTGRTPEARNLFFVTLPDEGKDVDFVATCRVNDFFPSDKYQQAGLIIHADDDNYVKFVCEYTGRPAPVLTALREIDGVSSVLKLTAPYKQEQYWIRAIRRGALYECQVSLDGEAFTSLGCLPWEGSPTRVGILAKNGGSVGREERDAAFDFFELRSPTEKEQDAPAAKCFEGLLGKWESESTTFDGKELTDAEATRVEITPLRFVMRDGENELDMPYLLHADAKPPYLQVGQPDTTSMHFLNYAFAVDGDALTLCVKPWQDAPAPDSLDAAEGDGRLRVQLRRADEKSGEGVER